MNLSTPVTLLSKVGKTSAKRLKDLGINTAQDLLYYFPFRYDDYSHIVKIKDLEEGKMVTVEAQIGILANKRTRNRYRMAITESLVSDDSGSMRVVWFNQPYITKILKPGDMVYLSGKVKRDMLGPELISPVYEKIKAGAAATHTARLVPIYPLTAGLTQKQIRYLVSQVVELAKNIPEWLSQEIRKEYNLAPISQALHDIHFPSGQEELDIALRRLKFDELLEIQLEAELARQNKAHIKAPALAFKEQAIKEFVQSLPYTLTSAQKVAAWEILQDLNKTTPMNRLLSGDVGSGKTAVAAMAIFDAFLNNYQAVMMAPTEILASQHYASLSKLFGKKITIGLLTQGRSEILNVELKSRTKVGRKKEFLEKISAGELELVIGTHALLSEGVKLKNLGLVVVDEQHRFGVSQRQLIKEKGEGVHFLSMTATPIPRSFALMLYGDLDISIIDQLPPGRKKILTRLVTAFNRNKAYDFIRAQVKLGRQVFVVCPLIEADDEESNIYFSPAQDKKSVMSEYQKLSATVFPDLKVGYLHGKLKSAEKEEIMTKFTEKKIDILVSTSVVEVGVDIPNASVMMIEGAERFGLAQLHQFRGRVGRSSHQSYCLLFTNSTSEKSLERLNFFEKENDGFKLAEKDLEIRGPGEVYGTMQSGLTSLQLAKLTDRELVKSAKEAAKKTAAKLYLYPSVEEKMKERKRRIHLE